jgi:DNA-binding transcriptional LysR family regulator
LESYLGVTLLNRSTRQFRVTEEGGLIYQRGVRILNDIEEMEDAFLGPDTEIQGSLRIDVPPTTALHILIPALPAFRKQHPRIRLEINIDARFSDLIKDGIDCAIRVGKFADSKLATRQLGVTRMVTCASPAYLAEHAEPKTPAHLAEHPCILSLSPATGRRREWLFNIDGETRAMQMDGDITFGTVEGCVLACEIGMGITQTVTFAVREQLRLGKLKPILLPWSAVGPPIQLVYPSGRVVSRRLRAFIEFAVEVFTPTLLSDEGPHGKKSLLEGDAHSLRGSRRRNKRSS